jgi:hypothetical protein
VVLWNNFQIQNSWKVSAEGLSVQNVNNLNMGYILLCSACIYIYIYIYISKVKSKAVPLHAMEALGGRGGIAPTHSRPRH